MSNTRGAAVVMALVVWGLAGALFGSLFAGLYQVLQVVGLESWQPLVVGAAAAATTTAAFYSSMPVALLGALAGVIASIGYLMATGHRVELLFIVAVAALAGLVAGVFYAWLGRGGMRPLAQTSVGLVSGLAAGGLLAVGVHLVDSQVGMFPLTAGIVALVGGLFRLSRRWIVSTSSVWCPRILSAPAVAALIAAVVGASIWIMGGATASALDASTKGAINGVLAQIPSGFLGGMLGGALTGVMLELVGVPLRDDR